MNKNKSKDKTDGNFENNDKNKHRNVHDELSNFEDEVEERIQEGEKNLGLYLYQVEYFSLKKDVFTKMINVNMTQHF